ncbi:aminoglycoside phosphotransferase [Pochonia chlamydosporia 170]|uniref:Aminoglycoside phosphotransferase n=1 Tax=Pochonia chlamydosporia 170 TaxID=1380566 RepID=A0A179F9C1_METCM|nr:aminoglycoside phosphotransferase [Pochonia chlamydosporia 170]OAQ62054.2 aminoglycoside phosphotransferase [Pochonia chlamydosporia 170]
MPARPIHQDRTDQHEPAWEGQLQSDQPQPQLHVPESNLSDSESLQNALDDDDNALVPMRYPALREAFLASLEDKKDVIEATVRLHLGVRSCHLSVREVWRSGSFSVVLPILISQTRTVFMRIPFPYRIGEDHCPGNVEEKLRTEIAPYIWLRQNCPDIPIPELHAFGLPDGSTFTHPLHTPFWEKAWWMLKRFGCSLLGRPIPVHHVKRTIRHSTTPGFLLISEARGKKLAWSWLDHYDKKAYRDRLFRSLARISLSLKAVPFPRIGSLRLQPDGSLALCNRPLSLYLQMLENEGIPTHIPLHRLYAQVESYLSDLLSFQDNKVRHQPNAVHDEEDGKLQLAALTGMRATMHHFIRPECRDGPFFLHLTDLHQKNIFVDQDWNIQTIIDLEWAHTLPLEMHLPPYWLSSRIAVDSFEDQAAIDDYEAILEEYWAIYEAEEKKRNGTIVDVAIQRDTWARGSFWYFHAVRVPKGMYTLFNRHIQPLFNKEHPDRKIFDEVFYWYWGSGAEGFIEKKLRDRKEYEASARAAFKEGSLKNT